MGRPGRSADAQGLVLGELFEIFGAASDAREAFAAASPVLGKVVGFDQGALCLGRGGALGGYDWIAQGLPEGFFAEYDRMLAEDFVLAAVSRAPNVALRDQDIGRRAELEASSWYRFCRDLRAPIEHVMAAMLSVEAGWHGGLVLYRDRKKPFSDREREAFQALVKPFGRMVSTCRRMWDAERKATAIEAILHVRGVESVLFSPSTREEARSAGLSELIAAWYGESEVPPHLLAQVAAAATKGGALLPVEIERIERDHGALEVRLAPVPVNGRIFLALIFEASRGALPRIWREKLTPREVEVTRALVQGWDNETIAGELGCSAGTVKKHLQRIFDKLGLSSRAALIAVAQRGG